MEKAWEEANLGWKMFDAAMEGPRALPHTPFLGTVVRDVYGFDGLHPYEREYEGAKALAEELQRLDDIRDAKVPGSDVLLMDFDTAFADGDGIAVVSIGNPEQAEHIGRVIPGLNNSLVDVGNTIDKAADIQEGVIMKRSAGWAADNSAVIAWLGYDTPNGFSDGYIGDEAREGARRLTEFTRQLRAGRGENQPSIHDYAHSFGTTVQGRATCDGMKVEDAVHLGSPGASCSGRQQLDYGAERVWAGTTLDDPIHLGAILAPLGPNPNWDPDVRRLPLDSRDNQSGHGDYFKRKTSGMDHLLNLQVGDHEAVQ